MSADWDENEHWYHPIDLKLPGVSVNCPRQSDMQPIWDQIRKVRASIVYSGKSVLDLAGATGMWAFEAEELGANPVITVDMGQPGYFEKLLLARAIRRSSVLPLSSVFVQNLYQHLEAYFTYYTEGKRFDIIQNLGLLYHVRDVLILLSQCRKCLLMGGEMLLEGGFYVDEEKMPLLLFNEENLIYHDDSTWWVPNKRCLYAMLRNTLFQPDDSTFSMFRQSDTIGRFCVVARAAGPETVSKRLMQELGLQQLT